MARDEGTDFESEAQRIARALWPADRPGGSEMVDGRERDGIYLSDDIVHHLEVTISGKVDKAEYDAHKGADFLKKNRNRADGRFPKAWQIFRDEPSAHQREAVRKIDSRIVVASFDAFRSKLVDGRMYLDLRRNAPWGSAANPENGSRTDLEPYIEVALDVDAGRDQHFTATATLADVQQALTGGGRVVVLGDYGAGKSMLIRALHERLASEFRSGASSVFPVSLNLREHYGQSSPAEALHRHAESIGYERPSQLVMAWRSGMVVVLLDGFDELASPGWSGSPASLRENRRIATELVREFAGQSSGSTGICVVGRQYYFDSMNELGSSLLNRYPHSVLSIGDFTEDEAQKYLHRSLGKNVALPGWLPGRPLLLGYLAANSLLSRTADSSALASPAEGWQWLLSRVCEREAFIQAGMDGPAVQAVLERLASKAREHSSGTGPINAFEVVEAFAAVRGQRPSDKELALLQRLPGLAGVEAGEEGNRRFVDEDLLAAAQAGDIVTFVSQPYHDIEGFVPQLWSAGLEPLAVQVAALRLDAPGLLPSLPAAVQSAARRDLDVLVSDLVRVGMAVGEDPAGGSNSTVNVSSAVIPELEIEEGGAQLAGVTFSDCLFGEVSIAGEIDGASSPTLIGCSIGSLYGRYGMEDLPEGVFTDCVVESFPDAAERNAAILQDAQLDAGTRVTLTVLRKLYLQRGRGRRESGLKRGLAAEDRQLVPVALKVLGREGLAVRSKIGRTEVWLPVRRQGKYVRDFIASPRSDHPLSGPASEVSRGSRPASG